MRKISDIISLTKNIEDPRQIKKVKYPINEAVLKGKSSLSSLYI